MGNSGRLAAIDRSEQRLGNIRQRIARAGATIVTLHRAGSEGFDSWNDTADAVLVDAPCTGVGTFRRNPGAKLRVTEAVCDDMARMQGSLLERYAAMVRPGGRLVYSTCSLLRGENEEVVEEFLGVRGDFTQVSAAEVLRERGIAVPGCDEALRFFPHRHGTDGFFAAVLQRSPL
jgi:16S rRNA (cytosine967-C5)-methyltransferase